MRFYNKTLLALACVLAAASALKAQPVVIANESLAPWTLLVKGDSTGRLPDAHFQLPAMTRVTLNPFGPGFPTARQIVLVDGNGHDDCRLNYAKNGQGHWTVQMVPDWGEEDNVVEAVVLGLDQTVAIVADTYRSDYPANAQALADPQVAPRVDPNNLPTSARRLF